MSLPLLAAALCLYPPLVGAADPPADEPAGEERTTTRPSAQPATQESEERDSPATRSRRREGSFLKERGPEIIELTARHLLLAFMAMLLATLIAVPLGVALSRVRNEFTANLVLGVVSIFQPIPSLALVALAGALFLALGLPTIGILPGLVALVVYALLPILRNTFTGIRQVDSTVIEVARGMGMTERQILHRIELPLALPVIMAGIRVGTVWTVGVATLVTLIGARSLGILIFQGLSGGHIELILAGALPAVALALGLDLFLGRFEKWLTPTGLRSASGNGV